MLKASRILVRCIALATCAASLAACGQKGPLFLPSDPVARGRATLPQTLGISSKPEQVSPAPVTAPLPEGPADASAKEHATPTGTGTPAPHKQQAD
ncbi:LPS translocon maturation chaperone LptM [Delftia tsuruhatensis]|uniref:LPS translocon maturation chaperone LptM n=1 Tax=Delftia tsuruhatensis TaxID=180282 RepID=UPI001F2FA3E3|nr:lipoprotein [Delftia tsuruhatensis]